jgi:carbon storage regulator
VLVLTRRKNQSIVIGDGITITVLDVKGDNIRLGITAPRDVQVFREELLTALSEANASSVLTDAPAPVPGPAAPATSAPSPLRLGARRRSLA